MQNQDTQTTNVVSIFKARDKAETADAAQTEGQDGKESGDFATVMERNQKNKERLEKERLQANKSVLKSYRIKH